MFREEFELVRTLRMVGAMLVEHVRSIRDDERGMTTETAIITAILVGLALAVTGAIGTVVARRILEINQG